MSAKVLHGECENVLPTLPDCSVDAVVTDPPYELGFMGKGWDSTGIAYNVDMWAEVLRVLKPGGHLLAFGGTRTWHRMAVAIEDAGFEMRDSIAWLYAAGFPKAWNFNTQYTGPWCACDGTNALPYSHAGNTDMPRVRDDIHAPAVARGTGKDPLLLAEVQRTGSGPGMGGSRSQGPRGVDGSIGSVLPGEDERRAESRMEGRVLHRAGQGIPDGAAAGPPAREGQRLRGGAPARDGADDRASGNATGGSASRQRGSVGQSTRELDAVRGPHGALDDGALRDGPKCARCGGLSPAFRGFSTALKPAFEPIVVARKPLQGTVAANVLAWGTGAINVDGCRVEGAFESGWSKSGSKAGPNDSMSGDNYARDPKPDNPAGRWPANVILDEHAAAELDVQTGVLTSGKMMPTHTVASRNIYGQDAEGGFTTMETYGDSGGASRFFYCAKAGKKERPRYHKSVLRLRDDLTPEQVDHVRARLAEAGVRVD